VTDPGCVEGGPIPGVQHVLGSAGCMRTGVVVQHEDTPRDHAGTLSCDSGTKSPGVPQ
jgi:hypothetical protein